MHREVAADERSSFIVVYWEGMDAKQLTDFYSDLADHQRRDCAGDQFWDVDEGAHLVLVLEVLSLRAFNFVYFVYFVYFVFFFVLP